jgi:small subunit ribosomal protein S5
MAKLRPLPTPPAKVVSNSKHHMAMSTPSATPSSTPPAGNAPAGNAPAGQNRGPGGPGGRGPGGRGPGGRGPGGRGPGGRGPGGRGPGGRGPGGRGPGGRGPGGRGRGGRDNGAAQDEGPELFEKVVFINRCSKVVKGGRRFSFSALVVVGDGKGQVGVNLGKANEVPEAIRKGTEGARKHMFKVEIKNDTIPHEALGNSDGGKVLIRPATPGTGLIAGGGVRAVLEAAGVHNVLTKSLGSNNHLAVVNATVEALKQLRVHATIKKLRQTEGDAA